MENERPAAAPRPAIAEFMVPCEVFFDASTGAILSCVPHLERVVLVIEGDEVLMQVRAPDQSRPAEGRS